MLGETKDGRFKAGVPVKEEDSIFFFHSKAFIYLYMSFQLAGDGERPKLTYQIRFFSTMVNLQKHMPYIYRHITSVCMTRDLSLTGPSVCQTLTMIN